MILLPGQTRLSQPQGIASLAPQFRRHATSLMLGDDRRDAVARDVTWQIPSRGVSKSGRALTQAYGAGSLVWVSDSSLVIPTGSEVTIVFVQDSQSSAGTSQAPSFSIGTAGSGGSSELNTYLPYGGDGKAYFRWAGEVEGATSVSGTSPGNDGQWVLSTGPGGMQIWRNGVLIASNNATPTRTGSSAALIADQSSIAFRDQSVPLFAVFAKQYSRDVNRDLSANPWQLFEPSRRSVPLAVSAGAAHTNTGSISADVATIAGTAVHKTLHATTGVLASNVAAIAGSVARQHVTTGVFAADDAIVAGSATHLTLHATSGALASDAATMAGGAVHSADNTHPLTGALAADAALIAGSATRKALHSTAGALSAGAATIVGAAQHPHTTTGALSAGAATIAGIAVHNILHATNGALASDVSSISGIAERTEDGVLASSGAILSGNSSIAGTANRTAVHAAVGALYSGDASVYGEARIASHRTDGAFAAGPAVMAGVAVHSGPGSVVESPFVVSYFKALREKSARRDRKKRIEEADKESSKRTAQEKITESVEAPAKAKKVIRRVRTTAVEPIAQNLVDIDAIFSEQKRKRGDAERQAVADAQKRYAEELLSINSAIAEYEAAELAAQQAQAALDAQAALVAQAALEAQLFSEEQEKQEVMYMAAQVQQMMSYAHNGGGKWKAVSSKLLRLSQMLAKRR